MTIQDKIDPDWKSLHETCSTCPPCLTCLCCWTSRWTWCTSRTLCWTRAERRMRMVQVQSQLHKHNNNSDLQLLIHDLHDDHHSGDCSEQGEEVFVSGLESFLIENWKSLWSMFEQRSAPGRWCQSECWDWWVWGWCWSSVSQDPVYHLHSSESSS